MTNFIRNEMENEIALYIGNYIRRHGYTPDFRTLARDMGMQYLVNCIPYIIGLVAMGMIRFSYVTPTPRLAMNRNK